MAVTPLFNDKDALLSRLRMLESSDTETLTVIDQVISSVRLEFFRRLTPARAIEIQGFGVEENPTTTEGILRSTAAVTEVYMVEYQLICTLPIMFIETEHAIQNSFDDVPLVRDAASLIPFKNTIKKAIEIGMGQLIQPIQENQGSFASFSTGAPTPVLIKNNFIGKRFP